MRLNFTIDTDDDDWLAVQTDSDHETVHIGTGSAGVTLTDSELSDWLKVVSIMQEMHSEAVIDALIDEQDETVFESDDDVIFPDVDGEPGPDADYLD